MKQFTEDELDAIKRMIKELRPGWGDAVIKHSEAPLPKAMPEVVGMSITEALMHALRTGSDQIRRECAFETWHGLPDRGEIHGFRGFHILCDALAAEDNACLIGEEDMP